MTQQHHYEPGDLDWASCERCERAISGRDCPRCGETPHPCRTCGVSAVIADDEVECEACRSVSWDARAVYDALNAAVRAGRRITIEAGTSGGSVHVAGCLVAFAGHDWARALKLALRPEGQS